MARNYEDGDLDEVDEICGWEAADLDDEFKTNTRTKKTITKSKPHKALIDLEPASRLATLCNKSHSQDSKLSQEKQLEKAIESQLKQAQMSENWLLNLQQKDNPEHHHLKLKYQASTKPSPRTFSLQKENAAIAASGRKRRMKIVAAAMASNVPRKSSIGAVVLASFECESDEKQEAAGMTMRKLDDRISSSAPQKQLQGKPPRISEPSTAPEFVELPKQLNLPLLNIHSGCGGNETKLFGNGPPPPEVARHWRRHREHKPSLLPSRDAFNNWESNFPPVLRRPRSPRKYQEDLPMADFTSSTVASVTKAIASRQENSTSSYLKEQLPLIHRTMQSVAASDTIVKAFAAMMNNKEITHRETKYCGDDDDERWTKCYDDPEMLAKSMAGLIETLSTFADKKQVSVSKTTGNRNRRRRAKLQPQAPSKTQALRLASSEYIPVTSTPLSEVLAPIARRRKHRKDRNRQHDS